MKRLTTILLLMLIAKTFAFSQCNQNLVDFCIGKISADATYLREYRVRLAESDAKEPAVARFSTLLTKGNTYRFNVCSALDFEGEAVLQINDRSSIVASTFDKTTKTNYSGLEMSCNKTGIYNIYISFVDGRPGCAVGVISLVNK